MTQAIATTPSRGTAKEYSPRRKPWVSAPKGVKPRRGERKCALQPLKSAENCPIRSILIAAHPEKSTSTPLGMLIPPRLVHLTYRTRLTKVLSRVPSKAQASADFCPVWPSQPWLRLSWRSSLRNPRNPSSLPTRTPPKPSRSTSTSSNCSSTSKTSTARSSRTSPRTTSRSPKTASLKPLSTSPPNRTCPSPSA